MKFEVMPSLGLLFTIACAAPAPPGQTSAPSATQKSERPAPPDPAASRADALIADMAKREVEYKKAEADVAARERLRPMPVTDSPARTPNGAPVPTAAAPTPTTGSAAPTSTGSLQFGGHDEVWWKNEMRTLQVRLDEDMRKFDAALAAWRGAIGSMNTKSVALAASAQDSALRSEREAQQLKAVVESDRDAIERLRKDARRADVPPGWLRWP